MPVLGELLAGLIGGEVHHGRPVFAYLRRPAHLNQVFRATVARFPDKLAVVAGEQQLTYTGLASAVDRCAAGMAAHGVLLGDRVALLLGNQAEFCIAALAGLHVGAVVVPLNTRLIGQELAYMLQNSRAVMLVTESTQWAKLVPLRADLPDLRVPCLIDGTAGDVIAFSDLMAEGRVTATADVHEHTVAFQCYTSGTTGLPKAALLTHCNIIHSLMNYALVKPLDADTISLIAVPIFHITGLVAQFLQMIYIGGTCILQPLPFRAGTGLTLMERHRVTHFFAVPTVYIMLLAHAEFATRDLSALRVLASGGAPLPPDVQVDLANRLPQAVFFNTYGLTEVASPATFLPDAYKRTKLGAIGLPMPTTELKIVDQEGVELPIGAAGELWIRGPHVLLEYFENPEANATAFHADGWFATGDVARCDNEGFYFILDRKKDMINRGGEKIYSAEVENAIYAHPAVLECAVVGVQDEFFGEVVKAVLVVRDKAELTPDGLKDFLRLRLADYKVPVQVEYRSELPRNPGGKVIKTQLR